MWKHFHVSKELTEENLTLEIDGNDSLVETIAEVGLERVQIEEEFSNKKLTPLFFTQSRQSAKIHHNQHDVIVVIKG